MKYKFLLVGKSADEWISNELYESLGGKQDTDFLILLDKLPVPLHRGHIGTLLHILLLSKMHLIDVLRNDRN